MEAFATRASLTLSHLSTGDYRGRRECPIALALVATLKRVHVVHVDRAAIVEFTSAVNLYTQCELLICSVGFY